MGKSSFGTQANALFLKNIAFQQRNLAENIRLILFPVLLCVGILVAQFVASKLRNVHADGKDNPMSIVLGTSDAILTPEKVPAFLQIPLPEARAVRTGFIPYQDLPDKSCKATGSCPVTVLVTGRNESLGESVVKNLFNSADLNFSPQTQVSLNSSTPIDTNDLLLGEVEHIPSYIRAVKKMTSKYEVIKAQCKYKAKVLILLQTASVNDTAEVKCVQGLGLWRNSSLLVNDELFKGYAEGNSENEANEILGAYDFLNTDETNFNLSIWYNSTYEKHSTILRAVNMASNAYLKFLNGTGIKMLLDFVEGMPMPPQNDFAGGLDSFIGGSLPLFFTWVILQLFPVIVTTLVYEKQQNLRMMMKMHGLGDGPYWMITYLYFLILSFAYMLCLMVSGNLIGMSIFKFTELSVQFAFYFIFINLQISFGFLLATAFSNVKTATVMAHMYVFGSGLIATFVFKSLVESTSFSRGWIVILQMCPAFSLYRGLYEFQDYSQRTSYVGHLVKLSWKDVNDGENGMREVFLLMIVEWFVMLIIAYYLDQVVSAGSGVRKHPLFFLKKSKKPPASCQQPTTQTQQPNIHVEIEKPDVSQEREKVKELMLKNDTSHSIVCDTLKKVYPSRDGNPEKIAVRGLSLALERGECFGMLGPNGAGKTSFISMMIGLTKPTSGVALVNGLDLATEMDEIYSSMGVCPQHDLLWECLTAREHLLFYGRLKNLKNSALMEAVEESLKSVNLFHGGVADKQAQTYSGGMKRRLSVAISLIGDPKVVYMDEPSTGLDPASRNQLWNIVKRAKKDRAIILTTHSMEEAEALCDRLGIFADGSLQCIGNPKELKARYGGSYVFTMTTSVSLEDEVENLVRQLSSNANKIYHLSGTQKFEIPKKDVRIGDVFRAVENAKSRFTINAWGLTDTTLEDVFIKVAQAALASTSTM
ncbi:hypothetical protein C5167_042471 [Papaver somniferum]|uniref:ABC transporter domain-containing protein n=1 Tax=Papaver somniferum TaxID=3469 RepID=A0A4Y7L3Z1_PAPSO|nr:ABC transporter A family member 7-like [Papaver somniferum]XP_026419102.1 ABC transporter A family member 7-like [Papaver somniferum]RZC79896.1 hypothetical protein C5167_042471 [Papaver somniferum]